jgi:hypothetical protein
MVAGTIFDPNISRFSSVGSSTANAKCFLVSEDGFNGLPEYSKVNW